jgi:hypothetical protein
MTMKKEGDRVPAISWPVRVRDDSIDGPNPFRWDTLDDLDVFSWPSCGSIQPARCVHTNLFDISGAWL